MSNNESDDESLGTPETELESDKVDVEEIPVDTIGEEIKEYGPNNCWVPIDQPNRDVFRFLSFPA